MNAFTPIIPLVEVGTVDSRLAFLHRAHARLILFEAGEMDIAEAFEGLVASLQCSCSRELVERWECEFPHRRQANSHRRPTPGATLDAVIYCVRQRGLAALKEQENIDRISRLTAAERARLDVRIEKIISQKRN
jgi:hypothetical protein